MKQYNKDALYRILGEESVTATLEVIAEVCRERVKRKAEQWLGDGLDAHVIAVWDARATLVQRAAGNPLTSN